MSRSTKRGFSLLEVMVASALFLVSLSGVISGIGSLSRVEEHQRRMTVATTCGEAAMEEILLRYVGHPDLDIGNRFTRFFNARGELVDAQDPAGMTAVATIGRLPAIPSLKEVKMTVTWTESSGEKSIEYFTYRP